MPSPLPVQFVGGNQGRYRVLQARAWVGEALPSVVRVEVCEGPSAVPPSPAVWTLRGVTSHQRYAEGPEGVRLREVQAGLGRPEATNAALIPITKSAAWWDMAQDERRAIFEDRSHHIAATMKFLPAIARRLHHGRDLGEAFDFVTWFEFAPEHTGLFDELLGLLRGTEEWRYVVHEASCACSARPEPRALVLTVTHLHTSQACRLCRNDLTVNCAQKARCLKANGLLTAAYALTTVALPS